MQQAHGGPGRSESPPGSALLGGTAPLANDLGLGARAFALGRQHAPRPPGTGVLPRPAGGIEHGHPAPRAPSSAAAVRPQTPPPSMVNASFITKLYVK